MSCGQLTISPSKNVTSTDHFQPSLVRLVLNPAPLPLTNFPSLETCPGHLAHVHAGAPLEPGTTDPNADAHGDFSVHRCLTAKKPGLFFFASGVRSDTMMVYQGHSFSAYRSDNPDRSLTLAVPRVSRSESTFWPGPYLCKNGIQRLYFVRLTPLPVSHSQARRLLYDQPSSPSVEQTVNSLTMHIKSFISFAPFTFTSARYLPRTSKLVLCLIDILPRSF
jgi:hypothetical protein